MLESLQQAVTRVQGLPSYATYKDKLTNTIAVVVESDAPRFTSGTDLIQTIRLVDESCSEGVPLCVFAKQVGDMPQAQLGDILELRNVVVQFWQDRPQLFAKISKPHSFGFLLYRPGGSNLQDSALAQPVQRYNTTPDSNHAARRLPELQALRLQALGNASAADSTLVYMRRIRDLAPPEEEGQRPACVDMRVKVLAIDERHKEEEVIMYVWDATDAKPVSASLQLPPSQWKGSELRVTRPRRHVMPLVSDSPGVQVLQDLPVIGTALPVIMEPGAVPSTGLPELGAWIKIKVVGIAAVQGQWQVVFGKASRLTLSQPSQGFDTLYQTRLANLDTCEWPQDLDRVATCCSAAALPRSTIREVLLKAAQKQAGPFRVQLRLLGYLPQELQHWCKLRVQQMETQPVWEWAAHLWLEDATGELRALLLGQEGTRLLGIGPQPLASSTAALQQLQARLQHLTCVDDDGGVWMDVALTPFYPAQQQQQQQEPHLLQPGQQQHGLNLEQQGLVLQDQPVHQQQGDGLLQEQLHPGGTMSTSAQQGLQRHAEEMQQLPSAATTAHGTLPMLLEHTVNMDAAQPVFVLHDAVYTQALALPDVAQHAVARPLRQNAESQDAHQQHASPGQLSPQQRQHHTRTPPSSSPENSQDPDAAQGSRKRPRHDGSGACTVG